MRLVCWLVAGFFGNFNFGGFGGPGGGGGGQQQRRPPPAKPASKGEDYYKLLGVKRNAKDPELKQAFRKLAKKWHPDKHFGEKNKKRAEAKFAKMSNAYDVLTDPEKRRIYDQQGEDGLKGGGGGGGGDPFGGKGGPGDDFFQQFFGGKGGGGGRRGGGGGNPFGGGGGGGGGPPPRKKWFKKTDVKELPSKWEKFLSERTFALVLLAHKGDAEAEAFKDQYITLAGQMKESVKFYACQCPDGPCDFKGGAELSFYPQSGSRKVMKGLKKPGKWVGDVMPDKTTKFAPKDLQKVEQWFAADDKPKVLVLSAKKEVSTLLKALSSEFDGRVQLGVVAGAQKAQQDAFQCPALPCVVGLTSASAGEVLGSPPARQSLVDFFAKLLRNRRRAMQDEALVKELTPASVAAGDCGPQDAHVCFVLVGAATEELRQLASKFKRDPVRFRWAEPNSKAARHLGAGFVALKPKRKRLRKMEDGESMATFVENVMSGGQLPEPLPGGLFEL